MNLEFFIHFQQDSTKTNTLSTPANEEACQRPPPAGRDFRGPFGQWQLLVATEHPSD